jgi:hypothetical protein
MACSVRSAAGDSWGAPWWKKTAQLRLGGVLGPEIVIQLEQRPAFQDVAGRDPALREPAIGQQLAKVPGVGLVGLGVPLAAASRGGVSRLADMRGNAGPGQLLSDVPPPGAPLQRERDVPAAGEPRQPSPQVQAVSRRDLAAPDLPGHGVEIVEGQLLPVNIQPAYDGHRDLLKLPRAPQAPACELPMQLIVTRLSWGGPPDVSDRGPPAQPPTPEQPMHVIYMSVGSGPPGRCRHGQPRTVSVRAI